jgi:hypothetical protein
MKKIAISQSNYIPWKGYFDGINTVEEFVLYDDMQYTRRDWRNRNKIKTKDGIKWLSIPVEVKGKYFQRINETKVSDMGWARDHWNTIIHNYRKAPYFELYKDFFEDLYLNTNEEYLSRINYRFLTAICGLLDIRTKFLWSSEFELLEDRNERLLDICKKREATDYYTGPSSQFYMDEALFSQQGVTVHYFDNSGYPEYTQQHGEFDHAVSIIDLLFNEGPNAKNFMKSFNTNPKPVQQSC